MKNHLRRNELSIMLLCLCADVRGRACIHVLLFYLCFQCFYPCPKSIPCPFSPMGTTDDWLELIDSLTNTGWNSQRLDLSTTLFFNFLFLSATFYQLPPIPSANLDLLLPTLRSRWLGWRWLGTDLSLPSRSGLNRVFIPTLPIFSPP